MQCKQMGGSAPDIVDEFDGKLPNVRLQAML
jgi:hypothetical protein